MLDFNPTKVLANARAATTEDLLDRMTAYRSGMEPEAVELFEMELRRRGVTPEQIAAHARQSQGCLRRADGTTLTGLAGYLRERGITRVFLAGLATDFCVACTAVDGRHAGFDVVVIEDACRAIDTAGSLAMAWERMQHAGVARVQAAHLGVGVARL